MRWSQTANFGSLPNEAMPNSFLGQTYDLHDPWHVDVSCYNWGCCNSNGGKPVANRSECVRHTRTLGGPAACSPFCSQLERTPLLSNRSGFEPAIPRQDMARPDG